jgi:hypothetical protein
MHRKIIGLIALSIVIWVQSCEFANKKAAEFISSALTDTTYKVEIPQGIGGILVCDVHYSDDFQTFEYSISYHYKKRLDSMVHIGNGTYCNTWKQKEQLLSIGAWTYLQTSADHHSDKLLIGQLDKPDSWREIVFSPKSIENDPMWISSQINSNPENYDSKVKIIDIDMKSGIINANYVFAKKNRIFSFMTGKRMITYELDKISGLPRMIRIKN